MDYKRDKLLKIKKDKNKSKKFKIQDLKTFTVVFWLLLTFYISLSASVSCFLYVASGFYQDRFGYNSIQSGSIRSMFYLLSAIFCPIFGWMADKFGKRLKMLMASAIVTAIFHVCCMLCSDSYHPLAPIFYLSMLALGYSIYTAVFWASIPNIVNENLIGTAFGLALALSNIGLVVFPIIVGHIIDYSTKDQGYFWASFTLTILACFGIVIVIIIDKIDKHNGVLKSIGPFSQKKNTF